MDNILEFCPICKKKGINSNIKLVPSGTSQRTGKPYSSFYSCTSRECNYTARFDSSEQPKIDVRTEQSNPTLLILDGIENIIKSQRDIWTLLDMINGKLDK